MMTLLAVLITCMMISVAAKSQVSHLYRIDSNGKALTFRTFCKNYFVCQIDKTKFSRFDSSNFALKSSFKVTGNVLYDANYRSFIDTPFLASGFVQHYLQTNLYFPIADKYPVQLIISSRRSNSEYFKDYFDVSVRFNQHDFNQAFKDKLQASLERKLREQVSLQDIAFRDWQQQDKQLHDITSFVLDSRQLQKLVEAREFLARQRSLSVQELKPINPKKEVLAKAITGQGEKFRSQAEASDFINVYESRKASIDSLEKQAEIYKSKYLQIKQEFTRKADSLKDKINAITDLRDFKKLDRSLVDSLSKKEKFLLGVRSFSIGRTPVDYSELSVKNISLTGVSLEHSGTWYWAIAAGGIDYRFRDFVFKSFQTPAQSLGVIRFGKGDPDKNHLILTGYKGWRNQPSFAASTGSRQPVYGLSLEARCDLGSNHSVVAEVAKSSSASIATSGGKRKTAFQLLDPGTMGVSLKFNSFLPKTETRLSGAYRFWGANFQPFTLYNPTANQSSWSLAIDQSFWKRTISLKAALRKNGFDNPYTLYHYESGTVFKSLFLSFRRKRLPYVSIGYLPTSQITKIDGALYENRFQMLMATASHFYKLGALRCNTLLTASHYFNSGWDSGFVYSNAKNLMFSHTLYCSQVLSATTTLSTSQSPDYRHDVIDQGIQANFLSGLGLGIGVKINQMNHRRNQTGYYGNLAWPLKRLGDISLSYESSWLPGLQKDLLVSNMGRITYYKRF